jgi:hypothetical protein
LVLIAEMAKCEIVRGGYFSICFFFFWTDLLLVSGILS